MMHKIRETKKYTFFKELKTGRTSIMENKTGNLTPFIYPDEPSYNDELCFLIECDDNEYNKYCKSKLKQYENV